MNILPAMFLGIFDAVCTVGLITLFIRIASDRLINLDFTRHSLLLRKTVKVGDFVTIEDASGEFRDGWVTEVLPLAQYKVRSDETPGVEWIVYKGYIFAPGYKGQLRLKDQ